MSNFKLCSKCGVIKLITEFYNDKKSKKDGYSYSCKTCTYTKDKILCECNELISKYYYDKHVNRPKHFKNLKLVNYIKSQPK